MTTGPQWITTAGFLTTATELAVFSTSVVASGTNVVYSLVSGRLPVGLAVSSTGTISGVPAAVIQTTAYQFAVRAASQEGVSDRTFRIDVQGAQPPIWSTLTGFSSFLDYNTSTAYLSFAPSAGIVALNRQWVNYQFQATANTAPPSTQLRFFIPTNGGTLPPGLTLSQNGILSGFLSDDLVFDGTAPDTGGYDEEAYDETSYDHGLIAVDSIGFPKIYQFKVTASDGILSSDRLFKVLVVSPAMIRNPEQLQITVEPGLISTNTDYLPPLQFVNSSNLGIARSENNETFDVSAYNGYPLLGTVRYEFVPGNSESTQLPDFLKLDTKQGVLYGYIPYQPAYTQTYNLTINAVRSLGNVSVTATNTFTLAIRGLVESSIEWESTSDLGTLFEGRLSELAVKAQQINSDYNIKYSLIEGNLPNGIQLLQDGSLSGRADYGTTGTYVFTVQAEDVLELSAIEQQFSLTVAAADNKQYTQIWVRPFLPLDKRDLYREFMTDAFVFPQSLMYRYFDPNFGVQTDIKMFLEFGIERQLLADYVPALRQNFYRRSFYFGDVKIAVAKSAGGDLLYELVYVDVIDKLELDSQTQGVSRVVHANNQIYYPASIENMRYRLEHLALDNGQLISTDEQQLPVFMRTAQADSYRPIGYVHVIPLCYALPGEGQKIISRIKLRNFDFKQFHLDIDRLIINKTTDYSNEKYLRFPRDSIGTVLESDFIIYAFDETPLETDQNQPINRT